MSTGNFDERFEKAMGDIDAELLGEVSDKRFMLTSGNNGSDTVKADNNAAAATVSRSSGTRRRRSSVNTAAVLVTFLLFAVVAVIGVIVLNRASHKPASPVSTLPAASDGPAAIRTTSPTECPTELLTPTPEPVTLRFLTDSAFSTSRKAEALGGDFKSAYARIALESLRKAYVKGQNTVLSPLSVITALALTANGARGTTQKQALELWSGEWDIDRLNEQLFSFREKLEADTDCRLVNADAVFLTEREDFIVNENYISLV
ncbi:MAG: hypothetical protein J6X19_02670, partial [Clostridia bacterium]|nr:hypothetical protein [Clostridia bacterium]